jgi:hypothetical protein
VFFRSLNESPYYTVYLVRWIPVPRGAFPNRLHSERDGLADARENRLVGYLFEIECLSEFRILC